MSVQSFRILAIDDQEDNLIVLKALLDEAFPEAQFFSANSGIMGLNLISLHHPDIILLDIVMPGMDGFEVCRRLKDDSETNHIPVVMITAVNTNKSFKIKALEAGADAFLSKPVDETEFRAQIRAMLRISISERKKKTEKEWLENEVNQRTLQLESELIERRKTEELLRRSEERFRNVSSSISDISYSCQNLNGEPYFLNWMAGATEKVFGYSINEIIQQKCWGKFVKPEDYSIFKSNIFDLKPGQSSVCELRLNHKSGKTVWVQASAQCVDNIEVPGTHSLFGAIIDITERKELEETVLIHFAAIEQNPASIVITDAEGNIEYVNPKFIEVTGYEKEELTGRNPRILKSGVTSDEEYRKMWECLSSGKSWQGEFTNRKKSGHLFYESAIISPLTDSKGNVTHYIGIKEDISLSKKADETILRTQQHYKALIENAPDGVVLISKEGNFIYESPSALKMFGYSATDIDGADPAHYTHPDDLLRVVQLLEHIILNPDSVQTLQYRFLHKSGKWLWLESTFSNLLANPAVNAIIINFKEITNRINAEQALRESEERYRILFENSPDSIFLADIDTGEILDANPKALELIGRKKEDVIGQNQRIIDPPEKWAASEHDFNEIIKFTKENAFPLQRISVIYCTDGRLIPVEITISQAQIQGKNVLQGVFRDISERLEAEEIIAQSQNLLKEAEKFVHMGSWNWDIDSNKISWSDELFRINDLDITSEPPEYDKLSQFYTVESWDKLKISIKKAIEEGLPYQLELEHQKADGRIQWVIARGNPVSDKNGKIIRLHGTVQDITETKLSQLARQESEVKFRSIFESGPVGMLVITPAGIITKVNEAFCTMIGYEISEIEGKDTQIFTHNDDKQLSATQLKNLIASTGNLIDFEKRYIHKSGKIIWVFLRAVVIRKPNLEPNYIVSHVVNITEQKQTLKELHDQKMFFEQMFLQSSISTQILDNEGWCQRINPKLSVLFGVKPEQIEGHVYNIFKDGEIQKNNIDKLLKKVFEQGKSVEWEVNFDIENASKTTGVQVIKPIKKWFLNWAYPIYNEEGKISHVIIQHTDISHRKEAEAALSEGESLITSIIKNAPFEIWARNREGVGIIANELVTKHFGTIIGVTPNDSMISETDLILWKSNNERVLGGEIINEECVYEINGENRIFQQIIAPIIRDKKIEGIVGFNIDVTERHKALDELRLSEEKYRLLFENITQAFALHEIILDQDNKPCDYKFISLNPAFYEHTGIEPNSLSGKTVKETFPDTEQFWIDKYGQVALTGIPTQFQNYSSAFDRFFEVWAFSPKTGQFATIFSDITYQEKNRRALIESERSLTTLINNLPGFSYRCLNTRSWDMEFLSKGCFDITGYHSEDFIHNKILSFNDIIHPDYRDFLWEKWQTVLTKKEYFVHEYPIIHSSGEIRWIWERGCGIYNNTGELLFLEGFITDITQRYLAEKKLKESETKFRKLFEHAPDGIIILDGNTGKILDCNPLWLNMSGYSLDEIKSKIFWEIPAFANISNSATSFNKIRKSEYLQMDEIPLIKHNGDELFVTFTSNYYLAEYYNVIQCNVRDISERRKANLIQKVLYSISKATNSSNDLGELTAIIRKELGTLLDTENFLIAYYNNQTGLLSSPLIFDQKDNIDTWKAEKSLTGIVVRKNEALLVSRTAILAMRDRGEIELYGSRAECWLGVPLHMDGKVFGAIVVQSYTNPNAYTHNDVEMLSFISRQISASILRKKTVDDLKIALDKATESDKLKSAFLANMSHEIRTPMNAILGFSDLLTEEGLSRDDRAEFVSIINRKGRDLLRIINDIIDISKIDSNLLNISRTAFDLNSLLENLRLSFDTERKRIEKHDIQIICEKGNKTQCYLYTDDVRLAQILNNLIGNAMKFTSNGYIKFGYTIEDSRILFYVSDTGKGIHPENHEIIFKRFRQEDETHTRIYGGTGLGLAISKGLIELLGGKIWLNSEIGRGSDFYFTLPASDQIKSEINFDSPQPIIIAPDLSNKIIMIAEDLPDNFELLKNQLRESNPILLHAENGQIAVEMFKENPDINLIIMDIRMPFLDGFEATRQIRKLNPSVPIIALTAHALEEDRERCINAGCNDYISKPFDRERLISLIHFYLFKS